MKKLNKKLGWIYAVLLIGIIIFLIFTPMFIQASDVIENDLGAKNHFDRTLLYWAIGVVGGCIAITLVYVSYRKYKGEQQKKKQKDSSPRK